MAIDRGIIKDQSYQNLLKDVRSILSPGQEQINKVIEDFKRKIAVDIELFINEGKGEFSFVGRHVPIKIGNETQFIDLVLYHEGRSCYVLVKLNIGKFESGDIGQMNKFVNYYRENRQSEGETDTIGLILCSEIDKEEIIYALHGLEDKIFVFEYRG